MSSYISIAARLVERCFAWGARCGPALLAVAMAFVVHRSALSSGFQRDDFLFFYEMRSSSLGSYLTTSYAGHIMLVPKLLLLLTYAAFGFKPEP